MAALLPFGQAADFLGELLPLPAQTTAIQSDTSIVGRFLVTKKENDIASFKTPNLRNVLITAPYFHDGSQATLWDVLDHYNKGDGIKDQWLDEDMQPLALSESEIDDVVAFLAALTSARYQVLSRNSASLCRGAISSSNMYLHEARYTRR